MAKAVRAAAGFERQRAPAAGLDGRDGLDGLVQRPHALVVRAA